MAQSQDGRDTVQEWVHKQKKETKKRKGKKTKEKELGLGLPVTGLDLWTYLVDRPIRSRFPI